MNPVAKEGMGNATSLFNLMRNLGGSIGIAILTALSTRYQQIHTNELQIENEELRKAPASAQQFSIGNPLGDSQFSMSQHNLPSPPTSFVGRETELAGRRLVQITAAHQGRPSPKDGRGENRSNHTTTRPTRPGKG